MDSKEISILHPWNKTGMNRSCQCIVEARLRGLDDTGEYGKNKNDKDAWLEKKVVD